jgi:hypothetical protein
MALSDMAIKTLGRAYLECLVQPGRKSQKTRHAENEQLLDGLSDEDASAVVRAAAEE